MSQSGHQMSCYTIVALTRGLPPSGVAHSCHLCLFGTDGVQSPLISRVLFLLPEGVRDCLSRPNNKWSVKLIITIMIHVQVHTSAFITSVPSFLGLCLCSTITSTCLHHNRHVVGNSRDLWAALVIDVRVAAILLQLGVIIKCTCNSLNIQLLNKVVLLESWQALTQYFITHAHVWLHFVGFCVHNYCTCTVYYSVYIYMPRIHDILYTICIHVHTKTG